MSQEPSSADAQDPPALLVQLSDLHLREGSEGLEPADRLARAVSRVAALEPRPRAVLVSGDLVDEPSRSAYAQARELLETLELPLHAIPGNHDDRDMLRECFGPASPVAGPVCFAAACGPLRLVGLDTAIPGHAGGRLGAEQLEWLAATLAQEPDTPTLLALHHPPVATGVRSMDAIALDGGDSAALELLLGSHAQVRAITCGHVHTAMVTSFAGRALLICPSTNSAVRLDLRAREDIPFTPAEQPLGFAVHVLASGRLVSHVQLL